MLTKFSEHLLSHYIMFIILETSCIANIVVFLATVYWLYSYYKQNQSENFKQQKLLVSNLVLSLCLEVGIPHFSINHEQEVLRLVAYS